MPPNVPNSTQLVAAANVDDQTPPGVTGAVGIGAASVTRTGAGIWVINLENQIDELDRKVSVNSSLAANAFCKVQLDPAVQTDSTIGILGFITAAGPVAGDCNWRFVCQRLAIFL